MTVTTDRVPIIHKTCGGVAFYYDHPPQSGEKRLSKYASHEDGTRIELGSVMLCDTCGHTAPQWSLTWEGKNW